MAAVELSPIDLEPFASIEFTKAQAMIEDALAMAALVAPCITEATFAYPDAARAIIRGAILRWNDAGTGAITQRIAGPFQESVTTQPRRGMFFPSEINDLARLCATSRAFEVDTLPTGAGASGTYGEDYWWSSPTTTQVL